jgi:peptide/nickel transport system permease protein
MLAYILRRLVVMIPTLLLVSIITFIIIQLPPGDFFTTLQAEVAETGGGQNKEVIKKLQEIYGLDEPAHMQYLRWISGWLRLDFGYSLEWNAPVWDVIASKLAYTIFLGVLSLIFIVIVSKPICIN